MRNVFAMILLATTATLAQAQTLTQARCIQQLSLFNASNVRIGTMSREVAVSKTTACDPMNSIESLRQLCDLNKSPILALTSLTSTAITYESVSRVQSNILVVPFDSAQTRFSLAAISYVCPTRTVAQENNALISSLRTQVSSLSQQITSLNQRITSLNNSNITLQSLLSAAQSEALYYRCNMVYYYNLLNRSAPQVFPAGCSAYNFINTYPFYYSPEAGYSGDLSAGSSGGNFGGGGF